MPFECYRVVVRKRHAAYKYFQFIQHGLLLWKLAKLKDLWTWYMYGIYHVYTWYMSCIYQVFLIWSFEGELCFLNISWVNIRLFSINKLVYSIALHINLWKKNFKIPCIFLGYTRYIPPLVSEYTWYIHGIYRLH